MDFSAALSDNDCVPAWRAGPGSISDPKFYDKKSSDRRADNRPARGQ